MPLESLLTAIYNYYKLYNNLKSQFNFIFNYTSYIYHLVDSFSLHILALFQQAAKKNRFSLTTTAIVERALMTNCISISINGLCHRSVPVRVAQCVDREVPHTWLHVNACQRASEPFTVLT